MREVEKKMEKNMMDAGFWSLVGQFIREMGRVIRGVLIGGDESDLLKSLGVRRGLGPSMRYFVFVFFLLPAKIAAFLLNPPIELYRVTERAVTPFLLLAIAFSRNVVAETYQDYLAALRTRGDIELKANIKDVSVFVTMFVVRKFVVAGLFVALLAVGFELGLGLIEMFVGGMSAVAATPALASLFDPDLPRVAALHAGVFAKEVSLLGQLSFSLLLVWAAGFIAIALLAYYLYMIIKIIVITFLQAYRLEEAQVENFLMDLLEYTHVKAKELYGEEVAKDALEATYLTFVVRRDVDMLVEDRLEAKQDLKLIKER